MQNKKKGFWRNAEKMKMISSEGRYGGKTTI